MSDERDTEEQAEPPKPPDKKVINDPLVHTDVEAPRTPFDSGTRSDE